MESELAGKQATLMCFILIEVNIDIRCIPYFFIFNTPLSISMIDVTNFDLEKQYKLYLQRVELNEATMHPAQRTETKRAFMGACGQLLMLFRDELSELEESQAIEFMEKMKNQVLQYWNNQTRGQN